MKKALITWSKRTRWLIKPRLVWLVSKIPECIPDWFKPVLKPFPKIYSRIYRMAYSSIKEEMLVLTPKGHYIYVNYWDNVEREIANGTYEKKYVDFFCSKVQEGDVVVDVGAYIGYFSLLASKRVGDKGCVYAFEPVPRNYERMMRNLKINKAENVKAYNIGLSDKSEISYIYVPQEIPAEASLATSWTELTKGIELTKNIIKVKLIPFDQFYKDEGLNKIKVIKIDVDGAELKVLRGMRNTLTNQMDMWLFLEVTPPLIKLLGGSVVELVKLLMEYGFKTAYSIEANSVINLSKLNVNDIIATFGNVSRNYILRKGENK